MRRASIAALLLAAGLSAGCSAILDTDELRGDPDVGVAEDSAILDMVYEGWILPDMGVCVAGKACTVPGKAGRCAIGEAECNDAGVGLCKAKYTAAAEKCDGIKAINDQDCDGKRDDQDSDAHKACGDGQYCAGSECKTGCWASSQCSGSTDQCTDHKCTCGTSGACSQPNPVCKDGKCQCDGDSRCRANETCKSGVCYCGSSKGGSAGPFCKVGTCNPNTGVCDGVPVDAGPDKAVPDTGAPDTGTPDTGVPDSQPPDQMAPDAPLPTPDAAVPDASIPTSDVGAAG